jgi:hypothetical protein
MADKTPDDERELVGRRRGSITASCGHRLTDEEGCGHSVMYQEWDCDAMSGYYPCVAYAQFCTKCRDDLVKQDYYLPDEEAAEKWLDSIPRPQPKGTVRWSHHSRMSRRNEVD